MFTPTVRDTVSRRFKVLIGRDMAIREIVFTPDPVLRRKAHKITSFDKDLQMLIDDMIETMRDGAGRWPGCPAGGRLRAPDCGRIRRR